MRAFTSTILLIFVLGSRLFAQEGTQVPAETSVVETKLTARPQIEAEKWKVVVYECYGQGQMRVTHGLSLSASPELVADLKVTLFLRGGRAVQPAVADGQKKFDGVSGHGMWSAGVSYDLAGIPLADLSEVQVGFHGQQSARTKFHAP